MSRHLERTRNSGNWFASRGTERQDGFHSGLLWIFGETAPTGNLPLARRPTNVLKDEIFMVSLYLTFAKQLIGEQPARAAAFARTVRPAPRSNVFKSTYTIADSESESH